MRYLKRRQMQAASLFMELPAIRRKGKEAGIRAAEGSVRKVITV